MAVRIKVKPIKKVQSKKLVLMGGKYKDPFHLIPLEGDVMNYDIIVKD